MASSWNLESLPSYSQADRHLMVFHPGYDGAQNQTVFQLPEPSQLWPSHQQPDHALFGRSTQTLANALGTGGANGGFNPLY